MFEFKMKTISIKSDINILTKEIINRKLSKEDLNLKGIGFHCEDIENVEFYKVGKRVYYKVGLKNGLVEESDVAFMPLAEILAIEQFTAKGGIA